MDFTFNEEQTLIQDQVDQFVQKEYDWETRQSLSNSDLGFGFRAVSDEVVNDGLLLRGSIESQTSPDAVGRPRRRWQLERRGAAVQQQRRRRRDVARRPGRLLRRRRRRFVTERCDRAQRPVC